MRTKSREGESGEGNWGKVEKQNAPDGASFNYLELIDGFKMGDVLGDVVQTFSARDLARHSPGRCQGKITKLSITNPSN